MIGLLAIIFLLINSTLLVSVSALLAQTSDAEAVSVDLSSSHEEILLGQPFTLTVAVNHPAGQRVQLSELGEEWGDMRVRHQSRLRTTADATGRETTQQSIGLARFRLGQFQTPPLNVTVRGDEGLLFDGLTPILTLTVTALITDIENVQLEDIRPQVAVPTPFSGPLPPWWVWPLLVGLIFTLVITWWLMRSRPTETATFVDTRPAHEVAWAELDRIERLNLPLQGQFKEQYILISNCLRAYLERRYNIPALDSTTTEIKTELTKLAQQTEPESSDDVSANTLTDPQIRQFLKLFKECDLGKFAEFTPTVDEANHLIESGRVIVQETKDVCQVLK